MKRFVLSILPIFVTALSAHGHPVETSLGTEPHVTYTGNFMDLGVTSVTLLTVPVGQDFLVNTALCNGNCILSIDGNPMMIEQMHLTDHNYSAGLFVAGKGNLVVPSGSTLSISISSNSNVGYFVNGKLVQQNHPRRSFFGTVGSSPTTVLSTTSTEVFVVTAMITSSASIDLYQDSTKIYDSRSYGSYYGMCNALCRGNVNIPIAAGTSLNLQSTSNSMYHYYLEGYFTQP